MLIHISTSTAVLLSRGWSLRIRQSENNIRTTLKRPAKKVITSMVIYARKSKIKIMKRYRKLSPL